MRNTIWTLTLTGLVAASLAAPAASAATASKQESIGVGSGAVVGAVAGGPVGFIIGAAIGAKLGDNMHSKDREIESLASTLDTSRDTIENLEANVGGLKSDIDSVVRELEEARRVSRPELVNLLQAGIAMDLLFRTDEHVLIDQTGSRLNELAQTVASMPDIHIRLDGFADERGASDYNLALSKKRVESVRALLVGAGIDESRIQTTAHGESPAMDESIDSLAFERRVSVKLYIDESPSFASTP